MTLLDQLLIVSKAYCASTGLSQSRVSTLVLKGGKRLEAIDAGNSDIATRIFERAMLWFSVHWPADKPWPEDIDRPEPPAEVDPAA